MLPCLCQNTVMHRIEFESLLMKGFRQLCGFFYIPLKFHSTFPMECKWNPKLLKARSTMRYGSLAWGVVSSFRYLPTMYSSIVLHQNARMAFVYLIMERFELLLYFNKKNFQYSDGIWKMLKSLKLKSFWKLSKAQIQCGTVFGLPRQS